ncbi:helix-turn-helix transcriptional regulator [Stutzerimonas stutzeri]|jgi:prophage regulatory protein|uniref:helix-turn-helix transcriptional regulator n=1 Tax=Stutzerimonas stutzeri TaxID=316 RepID=UPI00210E611D|nr:AlpA family phage regulatory protein [Stutzerimonas stutzeri]MCQ4261191.1 AlpA family transcriptional regulator [Stutzerimonas stutzeri]
MPSLLSSINSEPLPIPETDGYDALPQFPKRSPLPFLRTIRRQELRQIIPLSETTIYEMERRGEFPRRFNLTPRCVVWDLAEVEAWIEERKQTLRKDMSGPDVRLRKTRPVRASSDKVSGDVGLSQQEPPTP